jgi:alpha-L-rhamnosidase
LHGGLEIITGMFRGKKPINIRVRFGESVSEAMANVGEDTEV